MELGYAAWRVAAIAACGILYAVLYVKGLSLSHRAAYNTLKNLRLSLQGKLERQPLGVIQEKGDVYKRQDQHRLIHRSDRPDRGLLYLQPLCGAVSEEHRAIARRVSESRTPVMKHQKGTGDSRPSRGW